MDYTNKLDRKSANKRYYEKHKETVRSRSISRRIALKQKVSEYKASRGCLVCGENHPIVLDPHHLDPSTKYKAISKMCTDLESWDKIESELQKCVILCANHHRLLEAGVISLPS